MAIRFFKRLGLLYIEWGEEGRKRADCFWFRWRGEGLEKENGPEARTLQEVCVAFRKMPLVVLLGGEGVVCREYRTGESGIRRIVENGDLLWESKEQKDGRTEIVFLRRSSWDEIAMELKKGGVKVVTVHPVKAKPEEVSLRELAGRWFQEHGQAQGIWKKGREEENLAGILFQRWLRPVLIGCLLLSGVNFVVQKRLKEENLRQKKAWEQQKMVSEKEKGKTEREKLLWMRFYGEKGARFAGLADAVAAAVPKEVVLEEMQIFPLKKSPEEGEVLQVKGSLITVRGEASSSEEVARFSQQIASIGDVCQVRLISLEKSREHQSFTFKMEFLL